MKNPKLKDILIPLKSAREDKPAAQTYARAGFLRAWKGIIYLSGSRRKVNFPRCGVFRVAEA
jgi:hypothetical protein